MGHSTQCKQNQKHLRFISMGKKNDGKAIPWANEWKYLGVVLKSGKCFNCSMKDVLASFYCSLNSILRIKGRSDDIVMLRLLETHCLPILTYGIELIHVTDRDDRRQLRVAYNAIFRKMFGYSYSQSVTQLQPRNSVTPLASSSRHTSRHSKNTTFCVTSRHWVKTKFVTSLVVTSRHTLLETPHS